MADEPTTMSKLGGLIGSAGRPFLELLAGGVLGGVQAGSPGGVNMDEFNRVLAENRHRKQEQQQVNAQWDAVGDIAGVSEEQRAAAKKGGLDPTSLMPKYTIRADGSVAQETIGQPPQPYDDVKFSDTRRSAARQSHYFPSEPGEAVFREDPENPGQLLPMTVEGKPYVRPPRQFKPEGSGAAERSGERVARQKEVSLDRLFTQRQNLIAGAVKAGDSDTLAAVLPGLDDRIAAAIDDLPEGRQPRFRKLLTRAQESERAAEAALVAEAAKAEEAANAPWYKRYFGIGGNGGAAAPAAPATPSLAPTPQPTPAATPPPAATPSGTMGPVTLHPGVKVSPDDEIYMGSPGKDGKRPVFRAKRGQGPTPRDIANLGLTRVQ